MLALTRVKANGRRHPYLSGTLVELLYIHPRGHPSDLVVPVGALSAMNAADCDKLGRYADEVADAEIRSARIVAIDLHWAFGFVGFEALLSKVRELNRDATVIVGGITAGHYPRELLKRYPIDYVVRGDAEVAFPRLVRKILDGKPVALANVWQRHAADPLTQRLTQAEFDATDGISAEWFPSYLRRSRWDSSAFSLGRTLSVARGCPMRCPTCYGSYAETFGGGWLWRSTDSSVAAIRQAAETGTEHFRIVAGKPSPRRFNELLATIASGGPYAFRSQVGVFACTPPAAELAQPLAAAFPSGIVMSTTHPTDQVPSLDAAASREEWARWLQFSAATEGTPHNGVEVWALRRETLRAAARDMQNNTRTRVTDAGAWEVVRPMDGRAPADFEEVREAVRGHFSFVAARLLSPALARMLAPYGWLDDVEADPELGRFEGALEIARQIAADNWCRHRIPSFPDLKLWCAPIPRDQLLRRDARAFGNLAHDDGHFAWVGSAVPTSAFVEMQLEQCHDAARAWAEVPAADTLLIVPCPIGALSEQWLQTVSADGLFALQLPPGPDSPLRVDLLLALNALTVTASRDGAEVAMGRSDPGFYRRSSRRPLAPRTGDRQEA